MLYSKEHWYCYPLHFTDFAASQSLLKSLCTLQQETGLALQGGRAKEQDCLLSAEGHITSLSLETHGLLKRH